MTHYANGAALERSVMAVLRDRGWVCTRSAGSHSPADVWAARAGWDPLLVQAKASGAIFGMASVVAEVIARAVA